MTNFLDISLQSGFGKNCGDDPQPCEMKLWQDLQVPMVKYLVGFSQRGTIFIQVLPDLVLQGGGREGPDQDQVSEHPTGIWSEKKLGGFHWGRDLTLLISRRQSGQICKFRVKQSADGKMSDCQVFSLRL